MLIYRSAWKIKWEMGREREREIKKYSERKINIKTHMSSASHVTMYTIFVWAFPKIWTNIHSLSHVHQNFKLYSVVVVVFIHLANYWYSDCGHAWTLHWIRDEWCMRWNWYVFTFNITLIAVCICASLILLFYHHSSFLILLFPMCNRVAEIFYNLI